MKTTPEALVERIYEYVKEHGNPVKCMCDGAWNLLLDNQVTVRVWCEDTGYSHSVCVKGLVSVSSVYSRGLIYMRGNNEGVLTVAKMIGFQVEY